MVPFDDKSPFVTSGIRIGVSAVTTRGLNEEEVVGIVDLIDRALSNRSDEAVLEAIKGEVRDLMIHRPLFKA